MCTLTRKIIVSNKKQPSNIWDVEKIVSNFSYGHNMYISTCLPYKNSIVLHPQPNRIGTYFGTILGSPIIQLILNNNYSAEKCVTTNYLTIKYKALKSFSVFQIIAILFCLILQTIVLSKVGFASMTFTNYMPMFLCLFIIFALDIMFFSNCIMAHLELLDCFK